MRQEDDHSVLFGSGDELPSNHSRNPHFSELIETRLGRHQVLAGGAALGTLASLGAALPRVSLADEDAGQA